jgi:hypothetical protein
VADLYLGRDSPEATAAAGAPDKVAAAAPALTAAELQELAGTYREPATGLVRRVTLRDARLVIDTFDDAYELQPIGPRRFRLADAPEVEVEFERRGAQPRLRETSGSRPSLVFELVEPVQPSTADLAAYAGTYDSEELETTYALAIEAGRLALRDRRREVGALVPTVHDEFALGSMALRFDRDGSGRVTGFRLGQGRIRNLRFIRRSQ